MFTLQIYITSVMYLIFHSIEQMAVFSCRGVHMCTKCLNKKRDMQMFYLLLFFSDCTQFLSLSTVYVYYNIGILILAAKMVVDVYLCLS